MNKLSLKKSFVFLVATAFLVGGFFVSTAYADTINVPGDHATIQAAIDAATAGDTIDLAAGTYDLSAQLNITDAKPVSITGNGVATLKAVIDFGNTNGSKHLLTIYAGTETEPVTISGVTLDCDYKCYGLNTYDEAYGVLNDVTIKNSKGSALNVNGSTIVATNLNTSDNAWGAVNVDPGSGVTLPSVFTLVSGTLAEDNQIWSDGANVTETAIVTVTAPNGYTEYSYAGSLARRWANSALTNVATIASAPTVLYTTIQSAINAATAGDTIIVADGTYTYVSEGSPAPKGLIKVTKGVTIRAMAGTRPVIDGSGFDGVFKIHPSALLPGNTVIIEGFDIIGDETTSIAITTQGSYDVIPAKVIIRNNWFHGMVGGIDFWGAGAYLPSGWTSGVINTEITGNKFYDMVISGPYPGFGVMIEDPINLVTAGDYAVKIENNEFSNLPNNGANPGVGIVISRANDPLEAANVYIAGNSFTSVPVGIAIDGAVSIDVTDTKIINNNLSGTTLYGIMAGNIVNGPVNAENNYWGATPNFTTLVSGGVSYSPWYSNEAMTTLGNTTTLVDDKPTVTLPAPITTEVVTTEGTVQIDIPSGIVITGPIGWDGTIVTPTITTTTVAPVADSGNTTSVVGSIEVGFSDMLLTFDKAVQLVFAGQAGNSIGYSHGAGTFQQITAPCTGGNDEATQTASLGAGADCKMDVGGDLVVWTKHFSTFTTYTQTTTPSTGGNSGGGGGAVPCAPGQTSFCVPTLPTQASPVATEALEQVLGTSTGVIPGCGNRTTGFSSATGQTCVGNSVGQVLGAEKFHFSMFLKRGSSFDVKVKGPEVMELQKLLNALGHDSGTVDGKFGPKTRGAVVKFQLANGLKGDGIVGPLTRAVLNAR